MVAEIASGERDAADVLLLIAAIIFGVSALIQREDTPGALACVAWVALSVALLLQ